MKLTLTLVLLAVIASTAAGQTYNSNTGGYNTGYGHMYGSFGMAMATQNLYNSVQMQIQRLTARQAMIKQFGKAAVEKAERESAGSSAGSSSSAIKVSPAPVARSHGKFRPDATVDTGKLLGDTLGSSAEEKALLKQVYTTVKASYEKEAAAKGWQNNIAGALTFFIVSSATVYHDAPEPSEESVSALYQAIEQSLDEIPDFGKMPNKDKVAFNNLLIAFTAVPLATYIEGKQSGDAATVKTASQLAGQLLQMVLKTDPDKVRVENGSIKFGS